jgi:hypothetical protein
MLILSVDIQMTLAVDRKKDKGFACWREKFLAETMVVAL